MGGAEIFLFCFSFPCSVLSIFAFIFHFKFPLNKFRNIFHWFTHRLLDLFLVLPYNARWFILQLYCLHKRSITTSNYLAIFKLILSNDIYLMSLWRTLLEAAVPTREVYFRRERFRRVYQAFSNTLTRQAVLDSYLNQTYRWFDFVWMQTPHRQSCRPNEGLTTLMPHEIRLISGSCGISILILPPNALLLRHIWEFTIEICISLW